MKTIFEKLMRNNKLNWFECRYFLLVMWYECSFLSVVSGRRYFMNVKHGIPTSFIQKAFAIRLLIKERKRFQS